MNQSPLDTAIADTVADFRARADTLLGAAKPDGPDRVLIERTLSRMATLAGLLATNATPDGHPYVTEMRLLRGTLEDVAIRYRISAQQALNDFLAATFQRLVTVGLSLI